MNTERERAALSATKGKAMDDVLNDALLNLEHDNYECSDEGHENRQADVALIRAALAAQPAASAQPLLFAINSVLKSFKESEKAGYHTRDREFAIGILEYGLEKYHSAPVAASAEPSDMAHEIWAVAQLAPGEGIEDGAARVEALLSRYGRPAGDAPDREKLIDAVEKAISVGPMDTIHAEDRHAWGGAWHTEPPPEPREDHVHLQGRRSCARRAVDAVLVALAAQSGEKDPGGSK